MSRVEIHRLADLKKLKKPIVVLGFPGAGLVGSVAVSQIIDSLKMPLAGYFSSSDFAPLAAIHDYKPLPAARIHYSEKHNLVVVLSEMTIPVASSQDFAQRVYELANSLNASLIVSLGGISLKENPNDVYFVSSEVTMSKDIIARRLAKPIREGATTGIIGLLLTKGALEGFPVASILAEASEEFLDPRAAANAVKTFGRMTGLEISTANLDKDAAMVGKNIKEAVIKARVTRKRGPSVEEGGTMYG